MLHAQKLDDLIARDVFKNMQRTLTAEEWERAHLHDILALCKSACPSWTWSIHEGSGFIEGSRREGETTVYVELYLSPMTHRWSGSIAGLWRSMQGYNTHVYGTSALEVLLNLVATLATAPTAHTTELTRGVADEHRHPAQ